MNLANDAVTCRDKQRRRQVRARRRNGLDYVEVSPDQRSLKLFFIDEAPQQLTPANFRIEGGVRIRDIHVIGAVRVDRGDDDLDDYWLLTVDRFGDFSTHTLRIVKPGRKSRPDKPLDGFDPRYSQLAFTFKAGCPNDLDCKPQTSCPPRLRAETEINYLAKDYSSFRQIILDRLAALIPDWKERHVPDLGITLVELLAYVGDYLSYYQDAVATEAYLDTARRRISVRRHVRLVDYRLHEGCNARTWVVIQASRNVELDPAETYFITRYNDALRSSGAVLSTDDLRNVPSSTYEVFEPLIQDKALKLYSAHNEIKFYAWGDRECCLRRGATRATLDYKWKIEPESEPEPYDDYRGDEDHPKYEPPDYELRKYGLPKYSEAEYEQPSYQPPKYEQYSPPSEPEIILHLQPGEVLIFEEVKGAKTGNPADADLSRRHAVRLTKVTPGVDPLFGRQIVEIEWAEADALPFTLCISSVGPAEACCPEITDVSVARGNAILIDHGRTVDPETFVVPQGKEEGAGCEAIGQPRDKTIRPARFNPSLKFAPVTEREPFPKPQDVAREQARVLSGIAVRVRELIDSLWRKALSGQLLTAADLDLLRTIFGAKALVEVGLLDPHGEKWRKCSAADQAKAIGILIATEDRRLAKKFRRLAIIRARAEDGFVLDDLIAREVGEMFGEQFGKELAPSNPVLFGAASNALEQDPREALPAARLDEAVGAGIAQWEPRHDLLDSRPDDRHFVAEIDDDGFAHLRFGDGESGRAPQANARLVARYRAGNGKPGNIGAETISHIVFRKTRTSGVNLRPRNPLPAGGGIDPEPAAEAKLFAPGAFRKRLERAIIADDYARLAERNHKIQRAAASLQWAGSWKEACVAVDPLGSERADEQLLEQIERSLAGFSRIGHDLRAKPARYVPLDIELKICVLPHYLRGHVEAELLDLFSNRVLADGRRGLFHPDNLTFGESVYLSKLIATARSVTGVENAQMKRLHRLFEPPNQEIENGLLPIGPFEIAQLDNDPSFPERGKLNLILEGGR